MKKISKTIVSKLTLILGWISISFFCPANGVASTISIQLDYDLFGHVENTSAGVCAATSVINSFQYLVNKYPSIYGDTNLIPGAGNTIEDARNMLDEGWTYNGQTRSGMGAVAGTLTHQNIWESKLYWVQDFAPSTTVFDGMYWMPGTELSNWYYGEVLENAFPTWDFLWKELSHGEDVEIAFDGGGISHQVTLTSLSFDDSNDNKIWDDGETRWLDYLDPNNTTQLFTAELEYNNIYYYFDWNNGGVNDSVENVRIFAALSESDEIQIM